MGTSLLFCTKISATSSVTTLKTISISLLRQLYSELWKLNIVFLVRDGNSSRPGKTSSHGMARCAFLTSLDSGSGWGGAARAQLWSDALLELFRDAPMNLSRKPSTQVQLRPRNGVIRVIDQHRCQCVTVAQECGKQLPSWRAVFLPRSRGQRATLVEENGLNGTREQETES